MYNETTGPIVSEIDKAKELLISKLPKHGVTPLWKIMGAMVPRTPKPKAEVAVEVQGAATPPAGGGKTRRHGGSREESVDVDKSRPW
jgi:hypothetical protein